MYHFDWLKRHAERTPGKLALIDACSGRQLSYAQFNERANRLASFLKEELGVKSGERVSILAQNSAAYYEALFACGKMGAVLNTLNWRLATPELAYIIDDCQPRVLLYDAEFGEAAGALKAKSSIEQMVIDGETPNSEAHDGEAPEGKAPSGDSPMGEWAYEDALAAGDPAGVEMPRLTYDDTWAILYTSGTTGRPKGAQVTYGNFFYNAIGIGMAVDLTSQDTNLNVLPAFHAGGLGLFAGPTFHAGGTVIVMRSFDPAELLRLIETWRVSVILLVPAMYLILSQFPDFDRYDLSSVRSWSSGGSALPPSLVHEYAQKNIIIQQGFGMTETGPTVFLIGKEDALAKAGSVGKPVMHTEVHILDREGHVLGEEEIGELCVRGGNVTTGYWNRPDATAEAIVDGWLHSGDAAKYDQDGFYYIVDRWKDMFISGGENVYPAEVENVIYEHPAVAEVAVIGVPHTRWQEVGKAIVVVKEGQQLTEPEVIEFCQGKLARYKIPKSVAFVDVLPRTAAGKVLKRELLESYR